MKLQISAKCSDRFNAQIVDDKGDIKYYDGYVPDWFPGQNYGDYVMLDIDTETGQILNWKKPSKEDLEIFTNSAENEDI